ncbi:MAG: acetate--CoA ligase, partial [Cyanobacteriota bacterium]
AAVVSRPDEVKGEDVYAFVILNATHTASDALKQELMQHVVKEIGAIARPGEIRFTDALPKTRSGKIIRRFLRNLAAGEELVGDVSTMEDLSVLDQLRQG